MRRVAVMYVGHDFELHRMDGEVRAHFLRADAEWNQLTVYGDDGKARVLPRERIVMVVRHQ